MSQFSLKIEPTSSQNIIKFVLNSFLTQAKSYEFSNIEEAQESPLAQKLFYFPFVKTVYISQNFIALEKYNIVEWEDVQEEVASTISEYLASGQEVISSSVKKSNPISIYAESTPNPDVMKFVANKVLINGLYEFKSPELAKNAPIASVLFNFPFVKEVFVNNNYISVTKNDLATWDDIVFELRDFIKNYLAEGKPLFNDNLLQKYQDSEALFTEKQPVGPIEEKIVSILNEYVKPAVAQDGGNIAFKSYDINSQTVHVILQGACSGCPSSTVTLKNGIETMLRQMLPDDVKIVEAING